MCQQRTETEAEAKEVWILDLSAVGDAPTTWAHPYDGMEAFCRKYFGKDYARFHGNYAGGHNMQAGVDGIQCWMHTGDGEWTFDDEGDLVVMRRTAIQ